MPGSNILKLRTPILSSIQIPKQLKIMIEKKQLMNNNSAN